MKKIERNIDLLRVIASIMVVALHVGSLYGTEINPESPSYYFTIGNFYHSVTRTAVPSFIILSGYFLLRDIKNMDYKYQYKKTFKRIVIPTLIFSFLYVLLSMLMIVIKDGVSINVIIEPLVNWLKGQPFYHMWYMYMIIGLYLITPVLIRVRLKISDRSFEILGWIFMFFGMWIFYKNYNVIWPLQFILYLGYFILGYSLSNKVNKFKKSYLVYLVVSILMLLGISYLTEMIVRYNLFTPKFYFLAPLTPLIMISSLLLYIAFLKMDWIECDVSKISEQTFYIYLFHPGVKKVIEMGFDTIMKNPNPIWYIPFLTIIVYIISYTISKITNNLIKKYFFRRAS